jgi:cell division inhibitor SepF
MSFFRRAMIYLGLVDDDYDDYEPYDEPQQQPAARAARPVPVAPVAAPVPEQQMVDPMAGSSIRTLPRETMQMPMPEPAPSTGVTVTRPSVVRPIVPVQSAKVHVVEPGGFGDAQEIGDRLKSNQPVIISLQSVDPDLSRRLIDFCSGATYVLGGSMERVAKNVFLLTPSNVEVSAEEKRRLQERGLYRA